MPCGTCSIFSYSFQSSKLTRTPIPSNSYIRAFEVGRSPNSPKYELAVRLRTIKNGPVVRNRLRLPHAVLSSFRVGVICPSPSPIATAALAAGASVCGEETLIETIRNAGKSLPFDRLLCHTNSVEKLNTSGLGPILGPRGMMPSIKTGTVTKDVPAAISTMMGASEYRERLGVVRFAVGKLGFTPEQLRTNIRVFMEGVKRDISDLSDRFIKEIEEVVSSPPLYIPESGIPSPEIARYTHIYQLPVLILSPCFLSQVLSSTNAPGFTLNGDFKSPSSPPERDLTIL